MGMFIVPSSGKGVSSAVSSFTIDGTTSAMYTVNGAQANFAEKIALDKMLPLVQNLPLPLVGGGANDRRNQIGGKASLLSNSGVILDVFA